MVDEVQQQLVSAHSTLSTLLKEKEELKKENLRLKEWTQEKKNYVLHRLPAGTFVYRLRSLTERASADYYLCVQCFQDHVKSILQPAEYSFLTCPTCDTSLQIGRH
ncbi:hypothetical protein EY04_27560 [Pseudomonas chlororaphis]|nr:hypothetical protein EY04_27560 [Pseudomonas chlororaphis]